VFHQFYPEAEKTLNNEGFILGTGIAYHINTKTVDTS
jgi:hypothetical protein